MVKSSNARMNAKEIIDLIGLEGAAYLGGRTTDNASYALKETCVTCNTSMEECIKRNDKSINQLPFISGVR